MNVLKKIEERKDTSVAYFPKSPFEINKTHRKHSCSLWVFYGIGIKFDY